MPTTSAQPNRSRFEEILDEAISGEELDRLLASREAEIDRLLQEAYGAKERGDFAELEPLHVLLAEERAKFAARNR